MKSKLMAKFSNETFLEVVLMKEFHLSALDFWLKFDHNTCEANGAQTLSSNATSPYFPDDMFDTIKRQNNYSFHLLIFEIEATGYFFKNTIRSKAILTYFQNSSNFASSYFEIKPLKLH